MIHDQSSDKEEIHVPKAIYLACDRDLPLAGAIRKDLTNLPVRLWLKNGSK